MSPGTCVFCWVGALPLNQWFMCVSVVKIHVSSAGIMCCIQNNGMRSRSTGISYSLFVCFFWRRPVFVVRPCGDMKCDEPPEGQLKFTKDQG